MKRSDNYVLGILTGVEPPPTRFKRSANELVQAFYDAGYYVHRNTSITNMLNMREPKAIVAVDTAGDFHIVHAQQDNVHQDVMPQKIVEFIAID